MTRSILLVEDDQLLLDSLACLLEEESYEVATATSAEEALEKTAERHFDLVVTDVKMPGMSGMTMLGHLRQSSPETRAVVITGFADFEAPVEAFRLQVDDFLTKPFDDLTFLRSIRRAFEWLDRQVWWHRCMQRGFEDARQLSQWLLTEVCAASPQARERALRQRSLAGQLARALDLPDEVNERVGLGAILQSVGHPDELDSGASLCRSLAEQEPTLRQAWQDSSVVEWMGGGIACARAGSGAESAILAVVSRYDALAHPGDAAVGLSRQECLEVLRSNWSGPAEVLDELEKTLSGNREESPAEPAGGRRLLGLGLGYLHGGRPDLAREALRRLEGQAGCEALLGLALAEAACQQPEVGYELAGRALERARGSLQRADALATSAALGVALGRAQAATQLDEALAIYAGSGSNRGRVRALLLQAWGESLRPPPRQLQEAVARLEHEVEETGLHWVLTRERWLSQAVYALADSDRSWTARFSPRSEGEASATLEIEAFGALTMRAHGRELTNKDWKTNKSRSLFLILVLHNGNEVPDERLTDLFWEELEGDRAQGNLYSALTYIRRALKSPDGQGPDPVLHQRGCCRWNQDFTCKADFLDFSQAVTSGFEAWQNRNLDGAVEALERAVSLYQGDLLETVEDSWVLPYRNQFRDQATRALELLMEHHERSGQRERCLSLGEQLLSLDRCHQGAYHVLMRAWSDQPERVARLYWSCQEALQEELFMAPSAETTRLYKSIVGA